MKKESVDYIKHCIDSHEEKDYDPFLSDCPDIEAFFQLSVQAESLLAWYEFKPEWDVLQLDGNYGAITGLLCRRCRQVDVVEQDMEKSGMLQKRHVKFQNLNIYKAYQELGNLKLYDLIIILDVIDYINILPHLNQFLKKQGRLLLVAENRLGIKMFCGGIESGSGKPFAGFNKLQGGKHGFSRRDLEWALDEAGFTQRKSYYPLPDYRLPQLIYTDQYLPKRNVKERLAPYYVNKKTILIDEYHMYQDLIDNDLFPAMANSYVFECVKDGSFCTVDYAAISADRGRELSYATTIHNDGTVKKTPLYTEGMTEAENLVKRSRELSQRGIPVLPLKITKNCITMDYVKGQPLSLYLAEIVKKSKQAFMEVFDQLYQYICMASEEVPAEKNVLMDRETAGLKWGPVLEKAYMELIPLNCFYEKKDLLFYDQEFVKENCPVGYVMYRAIHYTYAFAPEIRGYYPIEELINRYHLQDTWDIYALEERSFIQRVRNHERYQSFLKWAGISPQQIEENINRLLYGWNQAEDKEMAFRIAWELLEKGRGIFDHINEKKVVVFGAGAIFVDYMEKHAKYSPVFLVDNNKEKWGTKKAGVLICNPEAILEVPEQERRVIICSIYYQEIGRQLEDMGITEYFVYNPSIV